MDTERLAAIIQRAKQGDKYAFEELYLDVHKSIYRFALRMLKNPEDAEDISQEVYITIQQKITELREPAAFYAWANQITANKCNRLLSKYKSVSKFVDDDEFLAIMDDDPTNMPDKALDDEATRKIINEVIDNLPDKQRVCILMFYYAQLTVVQIAETLEISENTVKSRLALGRSKIRAALEQKAKKDGIKLWGIPLALTPILREFIEQMAVPDGLDVRMWENIQQATAEGIQTNSLSQADTTSAHIDSPNVTSGKVDPNLTTEAVSAAAEAIGTAAGVGMTSVTKIIISCVVVAMLATGAFIVPGLFGTQGSTQAQSDMSVSENEALQERLAQAQDLEANLASTAVNSPYISLTTGDIIQFGGHDWRVLEVQEGKALILSERTLLSREDFGESGLTWENNNMRRYLNTTFYDTFSETEKALIAETRIVTNDNLWHGTTGGNDTTDKIFLLSIEEVLKYFGDSGQIYLGPEISSDPVPALSDQYNSSRIARNAAGTATFWWLRSTGFNSRVNIFIRTDGTVVVGGAAGINFQGMRLYDVRPALWLYTGIPTNELDPADTPSDSVAITPGNYINSDTEDISAEIADEAEFEAVYRALYDILRAAVNSFGIGPYPDPNLSDTESIFEEWNERMNSGLYAGQGVFYAELIYFGDSVLPQLLFIVDSGYGPGRHVSLAYVYGHTPAGVDQYRIHSELDTAFLIGGAGIREELYIVTDSSGINYLLWVSYDFERGDSYETYFTVRNGQWGEVPGVGIDIVNIRNLGYSPDSVRTVLAELQS